MTRGEWVTQASCVLLAIAACGPGSSGETKDFGHGSDLTTDGATTTPAGSSEDEGSSDGSGVRFDVAPTGTGTGGSGTDTGGEVDESTCEKAAESLTSAGCLFAPFVGNASSETYMGPLPWAVIAANTNVTTASVELFDPNGNSVDSVSIPVGELHVFELDGATNAQWETQDQTYLHVAFRLEADVPIVAYQFQPYSSSYSATADATILLPEHAWGDNHLFVDGKNDGDQWVTVVSLTDGNDVSVFMPGTMSGTTSAGGGIPALGAGDSHSVIVDRQQTLRIHAASPDMTGAIISSTDPIAVFAGSSGVSLPGPGFIGYQDYLEEQIPPRSAWGTEYAIVKFSPRGGESDLYRIIADKDGTAVTVGGDVNQVFMLDEGEHTQFETAEPFMATANEAFLVAHMMTSAGTASGPKDEMLYPGMFTSPNCNSASGASDMGDPAITYGVPLDQYRNRYTFLTPFTYSWDMLTVTAPVGYWSSILLDGQTLPQATPLPDDPDLGFVRILVDDGPHFIESPDTTFGIEVYGYDCRISYAYPGGLSLGSINIPPPPPG